MGLILAGMAGGLGAGLAGAAQEVDRRSREEDLLRERLADRAAAREQNVALQTMLAQQRADAARESNDTRLLIAAERAAGRSGSGSGGGAHSGGVADFSEGTPGEEALALRAGRTVPEIRKIRGVTREGTDGLAVDVTRTEDTAAGDPNADARDRLAGMKKTTTREVPAELKAFIKAEQANLDQAMTLLRAGGNSEQQAKAYGDLAQSRLMQRAADSPTIEGSRDAGQRLANTDPKGGAFDASGDNKFTGELGAVSQGEVALKGAKVKTEATAQGENSAQARAADALAAKRKGGGDDDKLTNKQIIDGYQKAINDLRAATGKADREQAQQLKAQFRQMLLDRGLKVPGAEGAAGAPDAAPKSAPLAPAVNERKDGAWYSNSKGELMRWNAAGKGWSR